MECSNRTSIVISAGQSERNWEKAFLSQTVKTKDCIVIACENSSWETERVCVISVDYDE